ncbi:MAG: pyridoxamine 5'-phosphate oxidase [Proteobacteria bacterium]|nr:pyridoxamine 5'-phosphate oxidase [Pseudomonadota bacterium]
MAADPIDRFRRWYRDAWRSGVPRADAMALATVESGGAPSVRYVLLKSIDAAGFVFFTDARSRKGRELSADPRVSAAFYWNARGRQVRIEGRVERVPEAEADAYWRTRPRASQLSAAASHQSRSLRSRAELVERRRRLERRYRDAEIPRPAGWSGFRIVPFAIEFWTHRDDRLHRRELFRLSRGRWRKTLLEP